MTREFDRRARSRLETTMFPESLDYTGVPVSEMVVIPAAVSFAREYIATYHYTRTMPDSTLHAFSGWLGDALAGIITYGMGVGRNPRQYRRSWRGRSFSCPNVRSGCRH